MESSKNHFLFYFLAIISSLSSAGATITIIALSSNFYQTDHSGIASSSIYMLFYLGVSVTGLIGGWILQHFTTIILGITGPLISAIIIFYLASFTQIPTNLGYPLVFCIFLIAGIDHPNCLRFFNEVIPEKQKMQFFSIKEGITYLFVIVAPVFAGMIIRLWGTRLCFIIDGGTYLLSCLPWFLIRKKISSKSQKERKSKWFIGFKLLISNQHIRNLNICRLLNNLSYVTWTSTLPLIIANFAIGDSNLFAQQQGIAISMVSVGFILSSLLGARLAKNQKLIVTMVWGASLLGFGSTTALILPANSLYIVYLCAFTIGIGTYCFRISGMTLGQAFTPKKELGAVIIASDAIIRGCSFLISLMIVNIFRIHETHLITSQALTTLIIILSSFSLLSPLLSLKLAKIFANRNHENRIET